MPRFGFTVNRKPYVVDTEPDRPLLEVLREDLKLTGTKFQPIKGPAETWEAARLDVTRACLEAFGTAASGGTPYLIPLEEMVHGASVTEAVVRSAASGQVEKVA